jgi:prepilin-type N-terminal cleavage/methylation domain-containing protein
MAKQKGFTLAELLIALGILAVISTFAIPKILASQANSQKKAVIREVVAALNDVTYQAVLKRDPALTPANMYVYYRDHLNVVRACPGSVNGPANDEKCWTQPFNVSGAFAFQGFVLHNGATLASFTNCCDLGGGQIGNTIAVDWNGPAPPNVYGEDQFELILSWGTVEITDWGSPGYRPGTVLPDYTKPASVSFYKSIFDN